MKQAEGKAGVIVLVRATAPFHDGSIPDRHGVYWGEGEEREVPFTIFEQLRASGPASWVVVKVVNQEQTSDKKKRTTRKN